jgi:hypothetical protein
MFMKSNWQKTSPPSNANIFYKDPVIEVDTGGMTKLPFVCHAGVAHGANGANLAQCS